MYIQNHSSADVLRPIQRAMGKAVSGVGSGLGYCLGLGLGIPTVPMRRLSFDGRRGRLERVPCEVSALNALERE